MNKAWEEGRQDGREAYDAFGEGVELIEDARNLARLAMAAVQESEEHASACPDCSAHRNFDRAAPENREVRWPQGCEAGERLIAKSRWLKEILSRRLAAVMRRKALNSDFDESSYLLIDLREQRRG